MLRRLLVAALLALSAISCAHAKPNIVVMMTDDMRFDDTDHMTNVQRLLIDQGVEFRNSFVNQSLCCPSRAGFITGQAAHNNGIRGNDPATHGGEFAMEATDNNTLPVWMKAAGYSTCIAGKYLNGYGTKADGSSDAASLSRVPSGWDEWHVTPDPLGTYNYTQYSFNDNGVITAYGNVVESGHPFPDPRFYLIDIGGQKAEHCLQTATAPFFLWWTPLAPHFGNGSEDPAFPSGPAAAPRHVGVNKNLPVPLPPNFNQPDMTGMPAFMQTLPQFDLSAVNFITTTYRNRKDTLLSVDEWVAKMVHDLDVRGVLSNTYIVFTSDNGWSQGEHRRTLNKNVVYEESIRVPLIIRGPGIAAGSKVDALVSNLDLVATIIDWAGATPGRTRDGVSLVPLFSNPNAAWRTAMGVEGLDAAVNGGDDTKRFIAVRTPNWVYAEHTTGEKELYYLARDRYQTWPLAGDSRFASVQSALATALATLSPCAGDPCNWTAPEPTAPTLPDLPSVVFLQSADTTAVNGDFGLKWDTVGATSCSLQRLAPNGTLSGTFASGTSGVKADNLSAVGLWRYWIDCKGLGGPARAELTHQVN